MYTPAAPAYEWRDDVSVAAWRPVPAADRPTVFWASAILIACIFLQRFSFPIGGEIKLPAVYLIGYAFVAALMLGGRLVVDARLGAMFCVAISLVTLSLVVSATNSSTMSFFYLFTIYVLYVFKLTYRGEETEVIRETYLRLMSFAAACGIAQFAAQFVVGPELAFPLETFVPAAFLTEGYNVVIPLQYQSTVFKSNGLFFLEPSFFSQFLGLAIVLELAGTQRLSRLGLYTTALIVSYSGTGILLIAALLPWILIKRGNVGLAVAGGFLALLLVALASVLDLSALTGRAGEFSSTESSGFARFISPFYMLDDFVLDSPKSVLFGIGAGAVETIMARAATLAYTAHDPTWVKLLIEYGILATGAVLAFVVIALFRGSDNRVLSAGVLFVYLLLGGYLLNPFMHLLFVVMVAWHSGRDELEDGEAHDEAWDEAADPVWDAERPEKWADQAGRHGARDRIEPRLS